MKKVCIFCSLSSFDTGMPISAYKLAAGLADTGRFDVRAVLQGEGELSERLRAAGVCVETISFNRLRMNPASLLLFWATWFGAGLRLWRYVRKNRIDIVHFSDIIDAPFYPWARVAGAKTVGHVRVCAGGRCAGFLYRLWARIFCGRVITVSEFVKKYYGFSDKHATVIYNPGPDRALFDAGKYPRRPPNAVPAVIAVATFRPDKGHRNFIEIASMIKKRLNGKVKFVIVGGKVSGREKYYGEVMAAARRLGLLDDGSLTVTGNVPHERMPEIMAGSAVLLHTVDWEEALGGVILEAMAMGVAVVAYDRGGVGECFTDGVSGFLVDHGDIAAAAKRAVALINDKGLRDKVTFAARKELNCKFTLANYVGAVERIYDGLLSYSSAN